MDLKSSTRKINMFKAIRKQKHPIKVKILYTNQNHCLEKDLNANYLIFI